MINHSPKEFYQGPEKQTPIQLLSSWSILGLSLFWVMVRDCGSLADTGGNGCMSFSQHSMSCPG